MNKSINWIRKNLFSNKTNTIVSISIIYLLYITIPPFIKWTILNANIIGNSRENCISGGACWVFIKVRLYQFMYGSYPLEHVWRINLAYILGLLGLSYLIISKSKNKYKFGIAFIISYPILSYFLFIGNFLNLVYIDTQKWGGLHLTLVVAISGIIGSLPLGILLALGRRSKMPIIKIFCVLFIEMWRGVPLISVLFMASVMLPIFLPNWLEIDKLLRAIIGVMLFSSAYMAEVIRGGLQAIPNGQYEAAKSLGLSYWPMMYLIILPQSLKIVIPGIVNTFIGLFKDTTLVWIVGLFDLLGMVQTANTSPNWLGYSIEGYLFAGFVFWIFCFSMSRYSIYLENKINKVQGEIN